VPRRGRRSAGRARLGGLWLAWLSMAVAAQIGSLAGSTAAQCLLLAVGGIVYLTARDRTRRPGRHRRASG